VLEIAVGHWPFSKHLANQNLFWSAFTVHFQWDGDQINNLQNVLDLPSVATCQCANKSCLLPAKF